MNSEQTHSIAGAFLQLHLVQIIEPWFVRTDRTSEPNPLMLNKAEMPSSIFIEYYY